MKLTVSCHKCHRIHTEEYNLDSGMKDKFKENVIYLYSYCPECMIWFYLKLTFTIEVVNAAPVRMS